MKILYYIGLLAVTGIIYMYSAIYVHAEEAANVHEVTLSSEVSDGNYVHGAVVDGVNVTEYDYVWHADPGTAHNEVKNSPAEYYTGTKPGKSDVVYIAHDIYYYPELDQNKFREIDYDGNHEWAYFYDAEGYEDYIFATLPVQKTGFPDDMMHSAKEAYENAVLHITEPGTYILHGEWHGQIWIDLGDEDDVFADETQKVTLILDGVDVTCTVAPAIVFAGVYECDNGWENNGGHSHIVDTAEAGAGVVIADGTTNNVSGTNIFRILKAQYKDEKSDKDYPAQKKRFKIDAALYSFQSMNIEGGESDTGVLNIDSGFEGVATELHLTINGGNINIFSQDDGVNVNEENVSVVTINGGNLHICAGLGAEGDGIDSNGFLIINGGTVISAAHPASDSGLDSDCGTYINAGTVVALGSTKDRAEADETSVSMQPTMNLHFSESKGSDEAIVITDLDGRVVFAYDPDKDEITGAHLRSFTGAIVSSANLSIGGRYHIYVGGDVRGNEIAGIYDITTVTDFTGAAMQCYIGNSINGLEGKGSAHERAADAYESTFTLTGTVNNFASVTDLRDDTIKADGEIQPNILLIVIGLVMVVTVTAVCIAARHRFMK